MTEQIEKLAKGLTKAQADALVQCAPWDVEVGAGAAIAFCVNGFLEDSTICDDGVQLTALGLAVRAHRLHGEWFSPHPDILAEIERLRGETA